MLGIVQALQRCFGCAELRGGAGGGLDRSAKPLLQYASLGGGNAIGGAPPGPPFNAASALVEHGAGGVGPSELCNFVGGAPQGPPFNGASAALGADGDGAGGGSALAGNFVGGAPQGPPFNAASSVGVHGAQVGRPSGTCNTIGGAPQGPPFNGAKAASAPVAEGTGGSSKLTCDMVGGAPQGPPLGAASAVGEHGAVGEGPCGACNDVGGAPEGPPFSGAVAAAEAGVVGTSGSREAVDLSVGGAPHGPPCDAECAGAAQSSMREGPSSVSGCGVPRAEETGTQVDAAGKGRGAVSGVQALRRVFERKEAAAAAEADGRVRRGSGSATGCFSVAAAAEVDGRPLRAAAGGSAAGSMLGGGGAAAAAVCARASMEAGGRLLGETAIGGAEEHAEQGKSTEVGLAGAGHAASEGRQGEASGGGASSQLRRRRAAVRRGGGGCALSR